VFQLSKRRFEKWPRSDTIDRVIPRARTHAHDPPPARPARPRRVAGREPQLRRHAREGADGARGLRARVASARQRRARRGARAVPADGVPAVPHADGARIPRPRPAYRPLLHRPRGGRAGVSVHRQHAAAHARPAGPAAARRSLRGRGVDRRRLRSRRRLPRDLLLSHRHSGAAGCRRHAQRGHHRDGSRVAGRAAARRSGRGARGPGARAARRVGALPRRHRGLGRALRETWLRAEPGRRGARRRRRGRALARGLRPAHAGLQLRAARPALDRGPPASRSRAGTGRARCAESNDSTGLR